MSYQVPDLKALIVRTAGAFRANLKNSDAVLWPNNVAVAAKVIGGAVWEPFSFLSYISRQVFAHTADATFLERHAHEWGLARLPAAYATGSVTLSGDVGIEVPSGLVLQRADAIEYVTTSGGVTNGDGELVVTVKAALPGKAGNALAGVTLSLAQPFDRLATEHVVAAGGIGAGADIESDASLRERVLFRKRNPPHGGAVFDYVAWARSINGVTRVFVDPITATNNRTTIGVWFLMDDTYTNGLPQQADVDAVAAFIDSVRPAGALVDVMAPVGQTINLTIEDLVPDTSAVREAIRAELILLFKRLGVATLTNPYTLPKSKLVEAISIATGEDSHTLSLPAGDVAIDTGKVPVLGTITYA